MKPAFPVTSTLRTASQQLKCAHRVPRSKACEPLERPAYQRFETDIAPRTARSIKSGGTRQCSARFLAVQGWPKTTNVISLGSVHRAEPQRDAEHPRHRCLRP